MKRGTLARGCFFCAVGYVVARSLGIDPGPYLTGGIILGWLWAAGR